MPDPSQEDKTSGVSYKDAGVDLDVYRESMSRLPRLMHRTFSPRVMLSDGGFAGLFQLQDAQNQYQDPVLVSGTDGVGTKLKIAKMLNKHDTVGIDLVAMCVNDVICCGAQPLFFLDYVAMSEDDPERLEQIVTGISEGCLQAKSALLGGETAIMPDHYQPGDYDLAGFQVGVVERAQLIDGKAIEVGDVVLGLASSGLHSNGYSLVRKIVFEAAGLTAETHVAELGHTVGEELLRPTQIYVGAMEAIRNASTNQLHGVAHITGGGLQENIERILPDHVNVEIDPTAWEVPTVFSWLQGLGQVELAEMRRVFNMGIGMTVMVPADQVDAIVREMSQQGLPCLTIGQVVSGTGEVVYRD